MSQAEHFVDFKNVWLAYNDALLAQNQFVFGLILHLYSNLLQLNH